MLHHQELVGGQAPLLGHRPTRLLEHVRDDGGGRHADLLEQDSVEHTARRAAPSVSDACDHDVAGLSRLLQDLLVRGHARVLLAEHLHLGRAVLRLQERADLLEDPVGVELRVLDERDALAREGLRPRSVRDGLRCRFGGGIEQLGHRLTSLVTACEERRLPQPGMYALNEPARPPAATTRMSSGVSTRGRIAVSSPGLSSPDMRPVRLRCACEFFVWSNRNWRIRFLSQPSFAIVSMCSPARQTTYVGWPITAPEIRMSSASVVSTPSAVFDSWL